MANEDTNTKELEFTYTKNVKNYQDIDTFQNDYHWMSQQWVEGILDYFNSYQKQADRYYQKHIDNPDMKSDYLNLYSHVEDQLTGAKNVLSVMGIKVEQWVKIIHG